MSTALSFKEKDLSTQINHYFEARWYQDACVEAILSFKKYKEGGNPLAVVPTGAGKSHIIGMLCKRILNKWPDQRILVISHVDTILEQDYITLREHLPAPDVGLFSAGVGKKIIRKVTVGGIQSLHGKHDLFKRTTIILIDEAHSVPPSGEGRYRKFLSNFSCPIIGLTATHFRLGSGYLHEGKGRIFTDIAYEVDIIRLIKEGYLSPLIPRNPKVKVDLEGVKTIAGDFSKREVAERMDREGLTDGIISDMTQYRDRYHHWLLFAIDIEHAELICALLNQSGISSIVVHSKQPKKLNNALKLDFQNGKYQCLISVESLTTGFDAPNIDLIALLRPTKSPALHIQMIGRGLRIHPKKEHCLVLDYAGNVSRLGPINDVRVKKKGSKKGPPITKVCPSCDTIHSGSVKECFLCGHEFEFKESIGIDSGNAAILAEKKAIKAHWYDVKSLEYTLYDGRGGQSLMARYGCGLRTFFEYKQFNKNSKGRSYAIHWWKYRRKNLNTAIPESSTEAHIRASSGDLRMPKRILVLEKGRYPEIIDIAF